MAKAKKTEALSCEYRPVMDQINTISDGTVSVLLKEALDKGKFPTMSDVNYRRYSVIDSIRQSWILFVINNPENQWLTWQDSWNSFIDSKIPYSHESTKVS